MRSINVIRAIAGLWAGLMICAGLATPAFAQTQSESEQTSGATSEPTQKEALLLQADSVRYFSELKVVEAEGSVQALYTDRTLRADKVVYFQSEDRVVAQGNVSLTEIDGTVFFAEEMELTDQFKDGVVEGFKALLADSSRVAAAKATRMGGNRHILTKGVYSACRVCDTDGEPRTPVWRIKAARVVQDQEDLTVSYRDVVLEVMGVPVFYLPYLSHPDPSVKRKSGLLPPIIGSSDRLGAFVRAPVFLALAKNYDATIEPYLVSDDASVLIGEWRHRTRRGQYSLEGSITNLQDRDDFGIRTGQRQLTGHIFGEGSFDVGQHRRWGFQVQNTNDDTYLRRYELDSETDLETTLFFDRIKKRNFAWVSGHYFQGLRAEDDQGETPFVLPRGKLHYTIDRGKLGRVNFDADTLILQRSEGVDTRRLSLSTDWQRRFMTPVGHVIRPFAYLRGDLYHVDDSDQNPGFGGGDGKRFFIRGLPAAGVDVSWPFIRPGKNVRLLVEPIAQAVVSPIGGNPEGLPNEDSQSLVFDTSNLFAFNKFSGLDRWEEGQRANIGLKLGAYLNEGGTAELMFGRSFRAREQLDFGVETGLASTSSDYVASLRLKPVSWLTFNQRMRIDSESFAVKLNEIETSLNYWRVNFYTQYFKVDKLNEAVGLPSSEELNLSGRLDLTRNWATTFGTRRDLASGNPLQSYAGIVYRDDCTIFSLAFQRNFFRDRDIQPSDSILFNIALRTLGDPEGYSFLPNEP